MTECQFEKGSLFLVFRQLSLMVMEALGVRRPGEQTTQEVEVDENGDV